MAVEQAANKMFAASENLPEFVSDVSLQVLSRWPNSRS